MSLMSMAGGGLEQRLSAGATAFYKDAYPHIADITPVRDRPVWTTLHNLVSDRDNAATIDGHISTLARQLAADRPTLLALLYAPHEAYALVVEKSGPQASYTANLWLPMCWLTEAAWLALTIVATSCGQDVAPEDDPPAGPAVDPAFTAGDVELLRPLAARTRMLLLTEPLRAEQWRDDSERPGVPALVAEAFGPNSLHELVDRARQARAAWLAYLDTYQSHPLLAVLPSAVLEYELSTLLFANRRRRLLLSSAAYESGAYRSGAYQRGDTEPSADDQVTTATVVERHLLPRMMIWTVVRLSRSGKADAWVPLLPVVAIASALLLVAFGKFQAAAGAAVFSYALIGLGSWWYGGVWSHQWLLRLPATATFGILALIAIDATWTTVPYAPRPLWLTLSAASYGYLLVEAGNHGVSRASAPWRALTVTAVAAVHATLVALIGLVLVAPSFVNKGDSLHELFTNHAQAAQAGTVLALAAAWCLTVGVFSQVLWDDRPITAALAHLKWRHER